MNKFEHLFFDLDRTLWDFEKNSHEEGWNEIQKKRFPGNNGQISGEIIQKSQIFF